MHAIDYFPPHIIKRNLYLDKALKYLDKDVVKILTGQRRVGKSYVLFQVMQYLEENQPGTNIVFISKEYPEYRFIKTDDDLLSYLKQKESHKKNYLFIDEVQEITGFEKALRSLLAQRKWDIWCTGSNASMLSQDVAGLMSGRSIEISIFGLSYAEFLQFHGMENSDNALNKFLRYGSLPYLIHLEMEDEMVNEYLRGIYSTILFKDVVSRHNIRNTAFLENLVRFAADNTGSMLSAKRISDYLKSQGVNMAPNRVIEYLLFLTEAFFLIKVRRADIKGKRIFEIGEKYYFEDVGLRNMISGFRADDINKIIENAVLLHLRIRGYTVYTGAIMGDKEIDFVCGRDAEKIYVQVAYLLPDDKVREREFGNLMMIKDNYPKYVVSMDSFKWDSYEGIQHFQLREFLLMEM